MHPVIDYNFTFCSVVHEDYEHTDVLIYSDGQLFWVPPVTSHTTCEGLDLTYWPWDFQDCAIVLGSWTKSGWQLDPVLMGHTKENVSYSPGLSKDLSSIIYNALRDST